MTDKNTNVYLSKHDKFLLFTKTNEYLLLSLKRVCWPSVNFEQVVDRQTLGSYTNSPTYAVDGAGTVQSGCCPRITAFDRAITVNGTIVIACQPSW